MASTKEDVDRARAVLPELRKELEQLDASDETLEWARTAASDEQCLRFLVGHNCKVKEVVKLMAASSKWRHEKQLPTLVETVESDQSVHARFARAYLPVTLLGVDPEGRSVTFLRMGAMDFPRLVPDDALGIDRMVMFSIWAVEKALRLTEKKVNSVVIDLDVRDHPNQVFSGLRELAPWVSSLIKFIKALSATFDLNYPETIYKIIFVRAPKMFWASWSIAKNFLAERTREKVEVYASPESSKERVLELFGEEIIPAHLGGKNPLDGVGIGGRLPDQGILEESFVAKLEESLKQPGVWTKPNAA